MLESMGHKLIEGNAIPISLNPDTKEKAEHLYKELFHARTDGIAPHDEFWGNRGPCKEKIVIRGCLMCQVRLLINNN
jgi:uncharacterized glyoxalase superfamily protein PhnB